LRGLLVVVLGLPDYSGLWRQKLAATAAAGARVTPRAPSSKSWNKGRETRAEFSFGV